MANFCEKCGAALPQNANVCGMCGYITDLGIKTVAENQNAIMEKLKKENKRIKRRKRFRNFLIFIAINVVFWGGLTIAGEITYAKTPCAICDEKGVEKLVSTDKLINNDEDTNNDNAESNTEYIYVREDGEYVTTDESIYVCEDCCSECSYCGDYDATKYGLNGFGQLVFLCESCSSQLITIN